MGPMWNVLIKCLVIYSLVVERNGKKLKFHANSSTPSHYTIPILPSIIEVFRVVVRSFGTHGNPSKCPVSQKRMPVENKLIVIGTQGTSTICLGYLTIWCSVSFGGHLVHMRIFKNDFRNLTPSTVMILVQ